MTNIPPGVAPSSRSWLGIAREIGGGGVSGVGTPTLPTNTIPLDKSSYEIEDTIKYLEDLSIRGSMSQRFADVLGVDDGTFSFGGPVFGDVFPFFFDNIFGDLSTTGTSPGNGTSTAAALAVGGTTVTIHSATGYANSGIVQIDSGNVSEVVVLNAAGGVSGTTLTFSSYPTRFAHGSGATVTTVTGPYTHTFALLNQTLGYGGVAGAQPPTHSLTDNTYLTPSTNARIYPGACVGQIELNGNAEGLFMGKASGNTLLSSTAPTIPVNSTTFTAPLPNWRSLLTIGTTSTFDVGEWTMTIKRELQVYWTQQNSQTPFIIARGTLDATGGLKFTVPSDETPLNYYLTNAEPEIQIVITNGLASTSLIQYTLTAHQCAFVKSKPVRTGVLVGYDDEYQTIANTSDVGGSGGLGQVTIQVVNNTPTY